MSKTDQHLAEAFAGESQANRRYLAFAARAEKEGHLQVARLFRAAAEAETVHALAHLRAMRGIGSTADNLRAAIEGETHEFKEMYPAMIADAEAEGAKAALRSFTFANEVEKIHAELYRKALDALERGEELPGAPYQVCTVCGYTCEGEPPDKCPVCNAGAKAFRRVE